MVNFSLKRILSARYNFPCLKNITLAFIQTCDKFDTCKETSLKKIIQTNPISDRYYEYGRVS